MGVSAGSLRAGMSLSFADVYVTIERVVREAAGMVAVTVKDYAGADCVARFHESEYMTVGA